MKAVPKCARYYNLYAFVKLGSQAVVVGSVKVNDDYVEVQHDSSTPFYQKESEFLFD